MQKRTLNPEEKINWIRIARSENIGPSTFFRIIKIFPDLEELIERIPSFSQNICHKKLKINDRISALIEIEKCEKFGAEILTFFDDDYPKLLREIDDPAPILTAKGNKNLLNQDIIAIVGARNSSFHACQFSEKFAQDLGENDVITASGLAKGIDSSAHKGSLKAGTIAIIAGGIDNIYPPENKLLYEQIFKKGVVACEQPFGAPPRGHNFIQRNRLISGISYATLVVEAGLQSGSLATARFATEQGRDVFAAPGFAADPRAAGNNKLIEDGAIFTRNADRILAEMPRYRALYQNVGKFEEPESKPFEAISPKFPSDNEINEVRKEIEQRIGFLPISIEDIVNEISASARLVNIALVQLELADLIIISQGKVIRK